MEKFHESVRITERDDAPNQGNSNVVSNRTKITKADLALLGISFDETEESMENALEEFSNQWESEHINFLEGLALHSDRLQDQVIQIKGINISSSVFDSFSGDDSNIKDVFPSFLEELSSIAADLKIEATMIGNEFSSFLEGVRQLHSRQYNFIRVILNNASSKSEEVLRGDMEQALNTFRTLNEEKLLDFRLSIDRMLAGLRVHFDQFLQQKSEHIRNFKTHCNSLPLSEDEEVYMLLFLADLSTSHESGVQQAIECYEEVLDVTPNNLIANKSLGDLYFKVYQEGLDICEPGEALLKARDYYEDAKLIDPKTETNNADADLYHKLAQVYYQLMDLDSAHKNARAAKYIKQDSVDGVFLEICHLLEKIEDDLSLWGSVLQTTH